MLLAPFAPAHPIAHSIERQNESAATELAEISLWPDRAPGAIGDGTEDRPSITPFLPATGHATGTAVVVFPGGSYRNLATDKEGVQPARWLTSRGAAAFVVRYRLGPRYHHPTMLQDGLRAVRLVRARAAEWRVNPDRIGVMGFSAGGHMAATVGTHFDSPDERAAGAAGETDAVDHTNARPDFMILLYPVITMDGRLAHTTSRLNLLGDHPAPDLVRLMSNETQVTHDTPPAFIVSTTDDGTVAVENSVMFYQALKAASVPAELHIFESGRHGFGMAPGDPVLSTWVSQCEGWLRRHGWI
jgi:acetyl esterase/lipase